MPKQIRMPKLSDTMEEGTLLQWRKREGDPVRRGEILADIETDKADMEYESYTEGTVAKLLVAPGTTVAVGTPIAIIALPGESAEEAVGAFESVALESAGAAVGVAEAMQIRENLNDFFAHPGVLPGDPTQAHDLLESGVSRHLELRLAEGLSETPTDVDLRQDEDGPRLRRPPQTLGVLTVQPGEDSLGVEHHHQEG